jgi:hypothetical protein
MKVTIMQFIKLNSRITNCLEELWVISKRKKREKKNGNRNRNMAFIN